MRVVKKIVLFLCLALLLPASAIADPITNTPCSQDSHTQTAIFKVPPGTYTAYISGDKGSDVGGLYLNPFNDLVPSHCQSIGQNIELNQQKNYAGQLTIGSANEVSWYLKQQSLVSQNVNANRKRIFLVPVGLKICTDTPCKPDSTHSEEVIPIQSNTATNNVVVAYYVDPANDNLQQVDYFADDNFLFSKTRLEPFPDEYKSIGLYSKLSTESRYTSGQMIINTQHLGEDSGDGSLSSFFRVYINPYKGKLIATGIVAGALFVIYILLLLYRRWHNIQEWKYNHGFKQRKVELYNEADAARALRRMEFLDRWLNIKRPLYAIGIFLVSYILLSTFIIDTFDVSGHSMDKTLHNQEKVAILKLPVTFAKSSHGSYIPHRGSIIVAKINESEGSYVSTFGNGKKSMIKRVVGLPGDRVVVQDNTIYVYKQDKGQPTIFGKGQPWAKTVQTTTDHYDINIVLGINQVFVAGDNRAASMDSRINGPIDAGQIIGVLIYKF